MRRTVPVTSEPTCNAYKALGKMTSINVAQHKYLPQVGAGHHSPWLLLSSRPPFGCLLQPPVLQRIPLVQHTP
jgi:hypothetical protein